MECRILVIFFALVLDLSGIIAYILNMSMSNFKDLKIYHILHYDRLQSVIEDGFLFSDSEAKKFDVDGTNIGINHIKERRLRIEFKIPHINLILY